MDTVIVGDGPLGWAIAAALSERGDRARLLGRPAGSAHDPIGLAGAEVAFEVSRGEAVARNVASLLEAGVRRIVIGTTAWEVDRSRVEALLVRHGAAAVAAPNLSLGMALFGRLVDAAVALYGGVPAFDPYIVEWHRRGKADRPSGTARALAARIVAAHPRVRRVADIGTGGASSPDSLEVIGIRAGANPGSHLVGFDAPGETIELRCTARDRSAYAAGALAAADWLRATRRTPGLHAFDDVVDDLLLADSEPSIAIAS
jgi:4-hydroxy-tetrahydrodipicolinate reductase